MLKDTITMTKEVRETGKIMGINVNSTTTSSVLARVENLISHNDRFYIVTPNPELILMAQKNKKLKIALNSANLSIPDGIGLKLADSKLKIIKGRELFMELIRLAEKKDWKIFLLGGIGDEAARAASKLKIQNPNLKIEYNKGPRLDNDAKAISDIDKKIEAEVIIRINEFKPQFLFVAFGNPKQEIWIHENLSKLNIGGAMAVGGAFRYVGGLSPLPPKWMVQFGLEWLWRLISEPRRVARVINAVVIFPWRVFVYKLFT